MDIQHTAMGIARFAEFTVQKMELQAQPGQSVTFTRYANLTRGGVVAEDASISERAMSASQTSITVTEYANAVSVTEKLLLLSYDDVLQEAAVLLGRDYAIVLDLAIRDTLRAGISNSIFAGDATSIATTDNNDVFDVEAVRRSVEILQTANAPKFNGDFYVGFVHPHGAAYLKRDPDWISANNYANTRALFNGELGRWEDVVFIASTHMGNGAVGATAEGYVAAYDATGAAGIDVYEAFIYGDMCVGWATALPVEMRESGVQDYGRKHGIAWYTIMGFGMLYGEYGVKVVHA
jgi:N4-gp56 family major capsid protein